MFIGLRPLILITLSVIFASSCAKIGEPHPPPILIPQRAQNLAGRQLGDQVILTCPIPKLNTNGTPVTTLKNVDIYRLEEARRQPPGPIAEQEFASLSTKIGSIDADELKDYAENDNFVFRDRLEPAQLNPAQKSFRYALKFVNVKNQDAGFSNYFYLSPLLLPDPPKSLRITYDQSAMKLSWEAPKGSKGESPPVEILGYNIVRRDEGMKEDRLLNEKPVLETSFTDSSFQFDRTYYYSVSIVVKADHKAETLKSRPTAITPHDTFPPSPPSQVTVFREGGQITLVWTPSPEPDVAGYHIYRTETSGKNYTKLNSTPIIPSTYKDSNSPSGKTVFYVVTAVDRSGNESSHSKEVSESP